MKSSSGSSDRSSELGFSLIELLVVVAIIGLLAAIAIPSFYNQSDKAQDADAKATARWAQEAMEAYSTEHDGRYIGADPEALHEIEDILPAGPPLAVSDVSARGYTVTVTSSTDTTFSVTREVSGSVTRTCSAGGTGGCLEGGSW